MCRHIARLVIALFFCWSCGDRNEIRVAEPEQRAVAAGKPVTGDWLVIHSLSDPEQLNPLTSSDASSSEVNSYIYESLLTREWRTMELKPYIAEARPEISPSACGASPVAPSDQTRRADA